MTIDLVPERVEAKTGRVHWSNWWPAMAIVAAGVAVGTVTQILQGVLPDAWGVLANSGVMWALCAFGLGATMPTTRWAVAGGAISLVIASVVYYEAVSWFEGSASDATGAIVWSIAGVVTGSVFGLLGWGVRHHHGLRHPALAVVAGVLVGEGIHLVWYVGNPTLRPAGIVELLVAGALVTVCLVGATRSFTWRGIGLIAVISAAATAATLAAMQVIDAAFMFS